MRVNEAEKGIKDTPPLALYPPHYRRAVISQEEVVEDPTEESAVMGRCPPTTDSPRCSPLVPESSSMPTPSLLCSPESCSVTPRHSLPPLPRSAGSGTDSSRCGPTRSELLLPPRHLHSTNHTDSARQGEIEAIPGSLLPVLLRYSEIFAWGHLKFCFKKNGTFKKIYCTKNDPCDVPGGLMAKTLSSHCRGPGFHPWAGS